MYKDRTEAALLLAKKLHYYKGKNAVVLAIPRGGVPLGFIISKVLNLPMEIVLSKKIGHPLHKEFAIGAVTLKSRILSNAAAEIPASYIEKETGRIREKLASRQKEYYGDREPLSLKDKILIVVDDGIATGNTMLSIIEMLYKEKPTKIVVAAPVAPHSTIKKFESSPIIDQVICPLVPDSFMAVGEFYENFDQVTDQEVQRLLQEASKAS
ncbi:putative phosphoribosyltransferase [Salegentibacter sp. 24]|uniref:phosphoribosyltransferase n=1 Tax=Salegentibacter sp. 24 TaxID=2183986 RepID=UPI001060B25D|nr:phosphoribosyltransferase family protein [Salegentibacter sp. 24]TDN83805.1 putative phosphoribosyltransferase [Salegentibacter sp. 24]